MEIWQFVVISLGAIVAGVMLAEPETLEEQAERQEKKRARKKRRARA